MNLPIEYVRIIITDKCNLKCNYCHKEGLKSIPSDTIDIDRFEKVMRILYGMGVKKVKFMGGEPTCSPQLVDLITVVKKIDSDIDISMISNGLFNINIINDCVEHGLNRVNISIHSWNDARTMQSVGMSKYSIDLLRKNIDTLNQMHLLSKVNYVLEGDTNLNELFDILEWADKQKIVVDVLNHLSIDGETGKYYLPFGDIERIIKDNTLIIDEKPKKNICSLPSKRLIMPNGGQVNLKVSKLRDYSPFRCCSSCEYVGACVEGINAIRYIPNKLFKPCLFREDNTLDITEEDDEALKTVLRKYLVEL